jgi:transcriptional regulator with GAF, ATPase, and Fis domain
VDAAAQNSTSSQDYGEVSFAEHAHMLAAVQQANWVIGGPSGAAARLGMKRTTLISWMQKLGITRLQ